MGGGQRLQRQIKPRAAYLIPEQGRLPESCKPAPGHVFADCHRASRAVRRRWNTSSGMSHAIPEGSTSTADRPNALLKNKDRLWLMRGG